MKKIGQPGIVACRGRIRSVMSHRQDDLADLLAGIHHGVRIASASQREGGMHNRPDLARLEQGPYMPLQRLSNILLEFHRARPQGRASKHQASTDRKSVV